MLVTVRAVTDFEHNGAEIASGDHFQTTVVDALRLRGQGKISLSVRRGGRFRASTPARLRRQADTSPERPDTSDDATAPPSPRDAPVSPTGHDLSSDAVPDKPRRSRGRRSYRRSEIDVDETTDLDADS